MSQALYRKWRSQTFEEVIGQEHVTQTLRNALREGRLAHAYLFSGPRGTGKTSTARILAKALNCTGPEEERPCNQCPTCLAINEGRMLDLVEIDAASNNSVEDIRELREKVGFRPSEGRYKVYIIDEVHMLSTSAFNALLKTLEEPPPHARFILATTEPHKIPATVLSRCQRFDFRRIPVTKITAHLRRIVETEGFQAQDEALVAIARSAQGCMRDAVSLLDQMLSYGTEQVTLEQVQQVLGSVASQSVTSFVDAVAQRDIPEGLALIHRLVSDGASLQEFTQQVVEHLRGVLLVQMTGDASLLEDQPPESVAQMERQAKEMGQARILAAIKRFSQAAQELKGGHQPQLPLELALIEAVQGEPRLEQALATEAAPPPQPRASAAKATPSSAPVAQPSPVKPSPAQPSATEPSPQEGGGAAGEPPPLDHAAVQRLRDDWQRFLAAAREECGLKVQAALRSMRDVAVGGDMVVLAFGKNQFARKMIAQPETRAQVSKLLSRFLGRPIRLECQDGDRAQLPAQALAGVREEIHDGPDPLIEFALGELGAELVEGSHAQGAQGENPESKGNET